MGSAARSSHFMDLNIAPMAWKMITGQAVTIFDFKGIDTLSATFMESLEEMPESRFKARYEHADICFNTTSLGGGSVDLILGGSRERLTWANRLQYCELLESYRLREMSVVAAAVRRGLATQLPPALLRLVRGDELERLVCGNPTIDVALLKSACDYNGYSEQDEVIVWFWEIMNEFSLEERKNYLKFIWGRSRLPLTKAAFSQRMKISVLTK